MSYLTGPMIFMRSDTTEKGAGERAKALATKTVGLSFDPRERIKELDSWKLFPELCICM